MAQSHDGRVGQISYWLDFLNSSLPLPPSPIPPDSKWCIILVGLRSDMQGAKQQFQQRHLLVWKGRWQCLPLHDELFVVSSKTSKQSVQMLLETVSRQCDHIFASHAIQLPLTFKQTLEHIRKHSSGDDVIFTEKDLFDACGSGVDQNVFSVMLQYFHEIGQLARLKGGLVCTNIQHISKIAAKFISPEEVRMTFLKKEHESVQILSKDDVGFLLDVTKSQQQKYVHKLFFKQFLQLKINLQQI